MAAIQSLAVDIANLTTRLAVTQASLNQVLTFGNRLNPGIWLTKRVQVPVQPDSPEAQPEYRLVTEVPLEDAETVQLLLSFLRSLQEEV
jgi:hypothetical protein